MIELRGIPEAQGAKVAVIVSRFNEFITKKLLEGALTTLKESGVADDDITVIWVPGSFELSAAVAEAIESGFDIAVCLGVVIRGETAHFDFVAGEAARGIGAIATKKRFPIGFGVITAEDTDQALARAGGKKGNKGREAALAAVEMADIFRRLRGQNRGMIV